MAGFRYQNTSAAALAVVDKPIERFVQLFETFDETRRFFEDASPLRFCATLLLTTPGEPADLWAQVRERDEELKSEFGILGAINPAFRLLLAAVLCKREDSGVEFVRSYKSAREQFRKHKLRRAPLNELVAFAILRGQQHNQPLPDALVARVRSIYLALRSHQYFLTGPEDLPACATFAGTQQSAKDIGLGTEACYQALRREAKFWPGECLHTASHLLYLSGIEAQQASERAAGLARAFRARGYKIRLEDYDNIALLCFLALEDHYIVDAVFASTQEIREALGLRWGKTLAFNLAVTVFFVQLQQGNVALERVSDWKTLFDMHAIITARQAAAS